MSEFGGLEIGAPGEGGSHAPEQLSEEAKQRFAATAAAMQQIRREERRSKKRDDQVAKAIIRFLANDQHTHLFLLVSRMVARDCPSIFILSILSLIDPESRAVVREYLQEATGAPQPGDGVENTALTKDGTLVDRDTNRTLVAWINHMQSVLALDAERILLSLMLDDRNVDGAVLQLTAFILQDFFVAQKREAPFAKMQPLAGNILQTIFEPFIGTVRKRYLARKAEDATQHGE